MGALMPKAVDGQRSRIARNASKIKRRERVVRAIVLLALTAVLALVGCQTHKLSIRRTRDGQELGTYRLRSLTGIRDGDKLLSEAVMGDDLGTLTMQMKFQVGVPTRLESGNYTWLKKDAPQIRGTIRADAVTFQGGQDGPPSLGGAFQLINNDVPLYEVRMPSTRMEPPGKNSIPR
jgi:hypothetical protein